jgi:hypothetical protein
MLAPNEAVFRGGVLGGDWVMRVLPSTINPINLLMDSYWILQERLHYNNNLFLSLSLSPVSSLPGYYE